MQIAGKESVKSIAVPLGYLAGKFGREPLAKIVYTPPWRGLNYGFLKVVGQNLPNPGNNFWSSTENYNNTANAWNVNLNNGNTNNNNKANKYYVRCVRSRKWILTQVLNFMAQYSHLPIYIKIYELIKVVYRIVQQFRKEYKYTLGTELQQIIWQILDEIISANSLPDSRKKDGIEEISRLFDKFKIRFRFAYEIGLITDKKFGIAQKEMEEIGKMIGGWSRWVA